MFSTARTADGEGLLAAGAARAGDDVREPIDEVRVDAMAPDDEADLVGGLQREKDEDGDDDDLGPAKGGGHREHWGLEGGPGR